MAPLGSERESNRLAMGDVTSDVSLRFFAFAVHEHRTASSRAARVTLPDKDKEIAALRLIALTRDRCSPEAMAPRTLLLADRRV